MINWKLRFKNKAIVLPLCVTVIAFIYQILGLLSIVPPVGEDIVTQLVTMIIDILAMVGIIIDPTTNGISDSERALQYDEPA